MYQMFISKQVYLKMKNWLLVLMYGVGCFGLIFMPEMFIPMSIWSLILTFLILLQDHFSFKNLTLFFLIALLGWIMEYVGVHYDVPFGIYEYGDGLGFKVSDIPLVIGLNWVIVTVSSWLTVHWTFPRWGLIQKILMSALLMTVLDILIEPVAPHLDYWMFQLNWPPIQNYIAWFWLGVLFSWLMSRVQWKRDSSTGVTVWMCQFFFFLILQLVY
jgi:putative membrane protein